MSVVDVVLAEIGELELDVGGRLPSERKLAERCHISRSSARNALKELQSKRVIEARPGSGYFLASEFALQQALDRQDEQWTLKRVVQILEARMLVATHVTELGSQKIIGESLQRLEDCLVDLGKAVINMDNYAIELLHSRFMNIIYESCSNPEYLRMLNEVRVPSRFFVAVLQSVEGNERNSFFSEHVNLFQAIKNKNHVLSKNICIQIFKKYKELFEKYEPNIYRNS